MQVPDFKTMIDPGMEGFATLTWKFITASGKPTLPPGITIVASNVNGNLGLVLASVLGIDPSPQSRVVVPPQIDPTGLIITAQVGNCVGAERYLVKLSVPFSNGDIITPWNHLMCDVPT